MNQQHVTLDISKAHGAPQVVRIGQGDRSGTTIVAHVYDNGTALDMSGMTARFCMRTPGNGYVEDESVTVSGSTLSYVVDEEHCASTAGYADECYFQILQGTDVIASTARFSIQILRAAMQGADPSRAWTNGIEEWLEDTQEVVERAEAAIEAMGDISELAVPTMSADVRGGARLGSGLSMSADVLSVIAMTDSEIDAAVDAAFSD